jgi:hypothetical protein
VQNVLKKMEELGTKLPELQLARKLIVGNVE